MKLIPFVKAAVTVKDAAVFYGYDVGRGDMMICPFHNDHHPSMKVYPDHYYCFGCHDSGDVIDFVGKLFNLSPYEAAKKIAADFHLNPTAPSSAAVPSVHNQLHESEAKCREARCVRALVRYEKLLKQEQEQYAPSYADEPWNEQFVRSCNTLPQLGQYLDDLYDPDKTVRRKTVDDLIDSGELNRIEKILALEKEVRSHGEDPCRAA